MNDAIYKALPQVDERGHEQVGVGAGGQPGWSEDRRGVVSISKDMSPEFGEMAPDEFLHTLAPSGLPPHVLRLRVGHPVMLLRNMDVPNGRTNGKVFTVVHVRDKAIALLPEGASPGTKWWWCPKIELSTENTEDFVFVRRQFPFKHAWAATINKSQGATLDRYVIMCDTQLFGHGQAYTALSRGRSQGTCKVYMCAGDAQADVMHSVVQQGLLGESHVTPSPESTSPKGPGEQEQFGALITEDDVIARYSGMHFCHTDGSHGRVVEARRRPGGGGWDAMFEWCDADGSAEPMSEGDDEYTQSDGTLRWHKEGQGNCVRNKFVHDQ